MGHAARANPRSFDGAKSIRERSRVYEARLDRFMSYFATRAEYESYVTGANLTDAERGYLEARLPERLRVQGSV